MPARDPNERALIARMAAHVKWAGVTDTNAATAAGRKAALERFERQVDPTGELPPDERARRAESARKAYFAKLALKSVQARRARRKADELDAEVETELANLADTAIDAA